MSFDKNTLAVIGLLATIFAGLGGLAGYLYKAHETQMERLSWYHAAFEGNYALVADELDRLRFRGFCISLAMSEQEPGVFRNVFKLNDDYRETAARHNRIAVVYNAFVGGLDFQSRRQMPERWEPINYQDLHFTLNAAAFQGRVDLREQCRERFGI